MRRVFIHEENPAGNPLVEKEIPAYLNIFPEAWFSLKIREK